MAEDIPPEIRRVVYRRDNGKCRWCGRTNAGIHLHHVIYRSTGGKHLPENLISLCGEHHALVHSDKPFYQPLLLELLQLEPSIIGYQLIRWKANGERRRAVRGLRDADSSDGEARSGTFAVSGTRTEGAVRRLIQAPKQPEGARPNPVLRMRGALQHDERTCRETETRIESQADLR